ncbi:MAG: helix-turn-helix domain-containing protein [Pseudomonadota bacterium]
MQQRTDMQARQRQNSLIGLRLRERRQQLGLRQGALAEVVGISPSYLNLIEHNKRRIGGKLLRDLARALALDPGTLADGADPALEQALLAAVADLPDHGAAPERDRIDVLSTRFPGWAGAIAGQAARIAALEDEAEALRNRAQHDTVLAEALHEVLSNAAAIRATAEILVEDGELDPQWRARFHRNLLEEAERLSDRGTELLRHFEAETEAATSSRDQFFIAAGHHFPQIEMHGEAAIDALLGSYGDAVTEAALRAYADDAARLPLGPFSDAARAADFEPERLFGLAGGDMALVLRRLAQLPPGEDMPDFGLAICDAQGALIYRRQLDGVGMPWIGPAPQLWPLYRVLARPFVLEAALLDSPGGGVFRTWSVSQPRSDGAELQATMLVRTVTPPSLAN